MRGEKNRISGWDDHQFDRNGKGVVQLYYFFFFPCSFIINPVPSNDRHWTGIQLAIGNDLNQHIDICMRKWSQDKKIVCL